MTNDENQRLIRRMANNQWIHYYDWWIFFCI